MKYFRENLCFLRDSMFQHIDFNELIFSGFYGASTEDSADLSEHLSLNGFQMKEYQVQTRRQKEHLQCQLLQHLQCLYDQGQPRYNE